MKVAKTFGFYFSIFMLALIYGATARADEAQGLEDVRGMTAVGSHPAGAFFIQDGQFVGAIEPGRIAPVCNFREREADAVPGPTVGLIRHGIFILPLQSKEHGSVVCYNLTEPGRARKPVTLPEVKQALGSRFALEMASPAQTLSFRDALKVFNGVNRSPSVDPIQVSARMTSDRSEDAGTPDAGTTMQGHAAGRSL